MGSVVVSSLAVLVVAHLVPGVRVEGLGWAVVVAVILGMVNAFLRPVLLVLTLPINIVSLGLFTLVVNAFLVLLVGELVPGFEVRGWVAAVWFGMGMWVVRGILKLLVGR